MVNIYYFDFSLLLKDYLKICVVCLLTVSGGWKSLRVLHHLVFTVLAVCTLLLGAADPHRLVFGFSGLSFYKCFHFKIKEEEERIYIKSWFKLSSCTFNKTYWYWPCAHHR